MAASVREWDDLADREVVSVSRRREFEREQVFPLPSVRIKSAWHLEGRAQAVAAERGADIDAEVPSPDDPRQHDASHARHNACPLDLELRHCPADNVCRSLTPQVLLQADPTVARR